MTPSISIIAQTSNPWTPYETPAAEKSKGKGGGGGGVTPEPATYGLVLVGLCLAFVLMARLSNRNVHHP